MLDYLWTRLKGVAAVVISIIDLLGIVVLMQRSRNKTEDERSENQRAAYLEANNDHTKDTLKTALEHRQKAINANEAAKEIKAEATLKIQKVKQNENAQAILNSLNS